ncbi:MAG: hypothetical protein M3307_04755 [Thermoproteota archaeon]|nr:hypothetical protein [Thermoproteota archaeon]
MNEQLTITATTYTFTKAHAIVLPNSGWNTNIPHHLFLFIKRGSLLSIVSVLESSRDSSSRRKSS